MLWNNTHLIKSFDYIKFYMPCSQNLKCNILFLLRGVRILHFSIINSRKKPWNIALAQIVRPLAGTVQLWWVQLIRRDCLKTQTCRRSHCWQRHHRLKCEIKPSTRGQRSNFKGTEVGKFVWFWLSWRFLGAQRLPTLRNGQRLNQLGLVSELFVGTNWTIWV